MAPLACLAILPVSRISGRPPTSIVTECGAGACLFSDICISSFDSSSEECTKQAWPAIDKEEKEGLFASANALERGHQEKRHLARRNGLGTITTSEDKAGAQIPRGICVFVNSQAMPLYKAASYLRRLRRSTIW